MFKWLKRLKNIELEETSNLNGLYTARIGDLKKIDKAIGKINKNIETINTTIGNINNRIDQFPSPNHIAVKNETNTFEEIQEIKNTSPYLAFRKPNNQRKGYIGTPASSSNDIELKAETNSLMLNANHNINLTSGNNYNTLVDKDPTVENAVANKRYVDTQIANVATPDLTNYARKDQENVFNQEQTINHTLNVETLNATSGDVKTVSTNMESIVNLGWLLGQGYAQLRQSNTFTNGNTFNDLTTFKHRVMRISDQAISQPKELVTKEYVDNKIKPVNLSTHHDISTNYSQSKLRMRRHVNGYLYGYEGLGGSFNVYTPSGLNGTYLMITRITGIRSGDGSRATTAGVTIAEVKRIKTTSTEFLPVNRVYFLIWSWIDLNTSGGDFDGRIDYETDFIKIGEY